MSGIQGFPTQEKLTNPLKGYDDQGSKTTSQFVTASQTPSKQVLLDTKSFGMARTGALAKSVTAVPTDFPKRIVKSTAHGAVKGDWIRFESGSANEYIEAMVIHVPDADTIILGTELASAILITDTFYILKPVSPRYNLDGSINVSTGPIEFIKDGSNQLVIEDTVTPANNVPLPVKLTGVTGDITVTAQNLNVQSTHNGANPDSMQIGDGTETLLITAAGEAKVQADQLPSTIGQKASAASLGVALSTEQEAQIGALTETAPATDTASSGLNGRLQRIAQRISSLIELFPSSIGQKASADSLSVVVASDQTVPVSILSTSGTIDANNSSTTPLSGGATFTGTATEIKNYGTINVNVYSNVASATDGLKVQFSTDGTNWDHEHIFTIGAGVSRGYNLASEWRYYRVVYTNGASAQATFRLQTVLKQPNIAPSTFRISHTMDDQHLASTVKAVLSAKTPGGTYTNIDCTNGGNLKAAVEEFEASLLGGLAEASSLGVTLSTENKALIGALTETAPATDTASSGLNGRLQRIAQRLTSLIALVPASLGQKTMANSFAVTIASDQTKLPSAGGRSKVAQLYNDYTSTSVTTAAYTQLTASTAADVNKVEVFDSSGQTMILAVGAAASEVDQFYIFPGGQGAVDLYIPSGSRIAIKAKTADASAGYVAVNLFS